MHSSHHKSNKGKAGVCDQVPSNDTGPIAVRRDPSEWDELLPVPHLSTRWAHAVVLTAAIACFANSYNADFVFDDSEALIGNKDVTGEVAVWDVFTHDFWGNKMASNLRHKSYRPLTVLTFRLVVHILNINLICR